jgi:outer membrane receptor protein involved in Fe transport
MRQSLLRLISFPLAFIAGPPEVQAHSGVLEEVLVVGRKAQTNSAVRGTNAGFVEREYLDRLALERSGDILELVPGLVATQHSGSGKANQYFLRGFNLDHGTDFLTRVDYMPVNMVSHGHGQGYTDLNFLIPELVQTIDYRKGPFYSDLGDFAGTGEAHLKTTAFLPGNLLSVEAGGFGYSRALLAGQREMGAGNWLLAGEFQDYDGPWKNVEEDVHKTNVWLKYASGGPEAGTDISLMFYDNRWSAADQIPLRAVESGEISHLSTIDPSSGGESQRYSLALQKRGHGENSVWFATVYAISYGMDLWSNFSYYSTGEEGDQIYQQDDRWLAGGDTAWTIAQSLVAGFKSSHSFGWNWRYDAIDPVGLLQSVERATTGPVRQDQVQQWSNALYWQMAVQFLPAWTSTLNLRWNFHNFDVEPISSAAPETLASNGGSRSADLWTGALRNRFALGERGELYWNLGRAYHSNDARGVLSTRDPVSGEAIEAADPLVPVDGTEIGGDWRSTDRLWQGSASLWALQVDSELLFVGDAGTTEDSGSESRRQGVELGLAYRPLETLQLFLDYSHSSSRLTDQNLEYRDIAGALDQVVSLRTALDWRSWQFSLAWRYLGDYALDEGQRADSAQKADLKISYLGHGPWRLDLSVLNLFDSGDYDIEYFYESQLLDEPEPVADRHIHSFVPRTARMKVSYEY